MRVEEAIKLRSLGKLIESNELLKSLVREYPDDAIVNYQCAWSYDVLELEKEAIPYYEKSIALGLPDEDLKEAYLGLGSTYRVIGNYEKSKCIFEEAISKFDDNSLKVFYAMTLYNLKTHSQSMDILLKLLATTSEDQSIKRYSKAINYYSSNLDHVVD